VAATLLGIGVSVAGIELWAPLMQAIKLLGDVVIPLMLFSLGVRLADARLAAWRAGVLVAVARPVLGVAAVAALLLVIELPPMQRALLLVFGALPPAILNYMFAERYRQEPHKVASMVMIGNLAAVLVLPLMLAFVLPAP
jgi:predicted permease